MHFGSELLYTKVIKYKPIFSISQSSIFSCLFLNPVNQNQEDGNNAHHPCAIAGVKPAFILQRAGSR
jgi:hypothetical protein